MSDALSQSLKDEVLEEKYIKYLEKLFYYLEYSSLDNEFAFYKALLEIAQADPTPGFIDQKIDLFRELKSGNKQTLLSLSKEVDEISNVKLKKLFQKLLQKQN